MKLPLTLRSLILALAFLKSSSSYIRCGSIKCSNSLNLLLPIKTLLFVFKYKEMIHSHIFKWLTFIKQLSDSEFSILILDKRGLVLWVKRTHHIWKIAHISGNDLQLLGLVMVIKLQIVLIVMIIIIIVELQILVLH